MLTSVQTAGLIELYQGEVLGEVVFNALLATAENADQRWKLSMMLQLETETKARLRPTLAAQGIDIAESADMRTRGLGLAASLGPLPWAEKMSTIHDLLRETFVPRFQQIEASFHGNSEVAKSMVEHETALMEMARREAAGESAGSACGVEALLTHPIPYPAG